MTIYRLIFSDGETANLTVTYDLGKLKGVIQGHGFAARAEKITTILTAVRDKFPGVKITMERKDAQRA